MLAALVMLAVGCEGVALAAAPVLTIAQPLTGSSSNSQTPTFAGSTDDALDAVTLNIYEGASAVGPPVRTLGDLAPIPIAPGEAKWEIGPVSTLAPGQYTAVAEQTNADPVTGTSAPVTFTIDTTPPGVSIEPVASPTSDPTPTLSGTGGVEAGDEPSVTVTIHEGSAAGKVVASSAAPVSGGAWSLTASHLADGTYTAQASQSDDAGNTGESTAVTFRVDTTPPTVSIDAVATPIKDPTPTLSGGAGVASGDQAGVSVTVYQGGSVGGTVVQTSTVSRSGSSWSWPVPELADGTYTAQATQDDAAGNRGESPAVTFTVDTATPAVSINAVATPTNNATPQLSGGAGVASGDQADVTLTIYEGSVAGGTVVQSSIVPRNGATWSSTSAKLADGTYTAQATQEDEAGNRGKSAAVTFSVDTKGPAVSIDAVAGFISNTTPTLTGAAGVASGDVASVTVTVYQGNSTSGQVIATKNVAPTGSTWSFTPGNALLPGQYTAQATQEDKAGNVGKSAAVTFTVDTLAPGVSINSVAAFTSDTTPTVAGGAGVAFGDNASVTVSIYEGGSASGKVAASEVVTPVGSTWSFTPGKALAQGVYTAQATQEDKAGNVGKSAAVTFTVDTTPPAVSVNSVATPSKNATPTLSGAAGAASGDQASVTVTLYEGGSTSGNVIASATVTPSGATWSLPVAKLVDGIYTAQATQEDKAGNVGKSAAVTFTVDTLAPGVSINSVAAFTNDTTPTVAGGAGVASGDNASVTVSIYEGGSVSGKVAASEVVMPVGSTWSFTPGKALAQGVYTAQAMQEDKAGNVGKSAAVTFTVDTTPPAVSINSVATPTRNATPTLSGAAGVASGDQPSVGVTIYEGSSAAGTVVQFTTATRSEAGWSWPVSKLADGTYTVQAVQDDEAGNVGKSAAVTFTLDTKAPAVSINSMAAFTSDTTPTFSGAAGAASGDQASVTVTVYEGASASGKVAAGEVVTPAGSTWSFTPGKALPQGQYTVQATQEDKAGNQGKSAAVTVTVDTTAPTVSINPVSTPTKNAAPTFTGSAGAASGDQASVTVTVYRGVPEEEVIVQSAGVSVNGGAWSYAASSALGDGAYTVRASQTDAAGNVATVRVAFTIDTAAPVVSINTVATPSKNATPKLLGGAGVAGGDRKTVTVNVYQGESVAGTPMESVPVAVAAGAWSYTTPTLADGVYTAQATQEDDAGNVGKSAPATFTVDTTAPVVAVNLIASPTKNQTPPVSGAAGVANGDQASVTVTVYKGASASGEVAASGVVTPSGATWSFTPGKALAQGAYTVQATQEDKAGNLGKSASATFTVDTTPPVVTVDAPTANQTIRISQPTFSGHAGTTAGDSQSVTLNVYEGGSTSGGVVEKLVVQREGEHWKAVSSKELSNGEYTAQAEQSDSAGNVGVSAEVQFKIQTKLTLDEFGLQREGAPTEFLTGPAPSFDGTAASGPGSSQSVTVRIYSGLSTSGKVERTLIVPRSGARWTSAPVAPVLSDGNYTVRAEQGAEFSEPFTFTVDADAPGVTLTSPANGTSTLGTSEAVGGAAGDQLEVAVKLYAGSAPSGTPVQSKTAGVSSGTWSTVFEGLAPGTYTAQAEQRDDVGNVGRSEPVTFTLLAPPVLTQATPPSAPVASFRWVPAAPHPGEPVTLISTSTDASSSITGFAWAAAGNGVFAAGEAALTTTFATAGAHVVELRVIDANGLSSTVAATIPVTSPAPALMQPFPVVRIAGSFSSSGAKISLLTVLAPVGATVKVTCRGRGCVTKSQHLTVASGAKSKSGTVLINFRRFERTFKAGVVLDVWVFAPGQIGKFTRFLIRHGKTPSRTDMCLNSAGTKPIVCPSS